MEKIQKVMTNQGWRETRLGDIGAFRGGVTSIKKKDYGFGTPFITYMNIFKNSKVSLDDLTLMNVSEKDLKRFECKYGDIFFTASSETEGEVAMSSVLLEEIKDLTFNGFSKRFRLNNFETLTPMFARYLLRSKNFRNSVKQLVTGDVRFNISQESLKSIQVVLPPLPEQKAIAEILSSLDDKIDLLHHQNKTLEDMAQALFRKWFVEDADEEWEEKPLSYFGDIICGKTPPKKVHRYFGGMIPFIKIPDMHGNTFIFDTTDTLTEEGKNSQNNKTLPSKSICVSCIATVGLVSMNAFESQTNQQINSIIPRKDKYRYFIYLFMKSSNALLHAMASGGTATMNLNTGNFSKIMVPSGDENSISEFHYILKPAFEKIFSNQSQIRTLEKLRDTLLPKLMNGKVKLDKLKLAQ